MMRVDRQRDLVPSFSSLDTRMVGYGSSLSCSMSE